MPGKSLRNLRRLAAPRDVEESRGLRLAVWASVCVSIVALALQEVINPSVVLVSLLLITAGFLFSWWRRHRPNILIKLAIATLTLVALASFLRQSYLQPYDTRVPLAELFLWVQVLHSFDLPRRRDLLFSLVSSFILLALAASYSLSATFAWMVLLWLACAAPSLYFAQRSRLSSFSRNGSGKYPSGAALKGVSATLSLLLAAVVVIGLLVGAFIPRFPATYIRSLPFSLRRPWFSAQGYSVRNPGYPQLPLRPPDRPLEVNPEAYFGFGPYLDLRARGKLLDLPVMRVRASEPAYWRGLAFTTYNGYSWLLPEEEPPRLGTSQQPFNLPAPEKDVHLAGKTILQTYYLQNDQPNVVFTAYRPSLLYYPSDYVYYDESGIRSPFELAEGLVYSVISNAIDFSDEELSALGGSVMQGHLHPYLEFSASQDALRDYPYLAGSEKLGYLELPPLPERVIQLAREIIPRDAGPMQRVRAIEDFLRREYAYSLDVPPLPPGEDAVDYFLFEARRGYCEHFATAHAVLCRLAGVPSRVVTGYATGDYNPVTGLYEVSLDDAHAWVEVYLVGVGWVTREPTPGFSLPEIRGSYGVFWVFRDFFAWVGRSLSSILPPSLRSALKRGFSALGQGLQALASGVAYSSREAPWLPILFALLLLAALAARRRGRRQGAPLPLAAGEPQALMGMFLEDARRLGYPRPPGSTLKEYFTVLQEAIPGLDLREELFLYEKARYGGRSLEGGEFERLRQGILRALERVRDATRTAPSSLFHLAGWRRANRRQDPGP
ncbi:transglutaminase TgpA family protein [Candidatus Solincola sp.]|nr:DUF3488 and transglutaminase-like domain-containing protein [Actinomycetota bacterium]MDI7251390.1 DUF3488 and transglutaminase-like domain-containing protein [Actinomycetota bacterium]